MDTGPDRIDQPVSQTTGGTGISPNRMSGNRILSTTTSLACSLLVLSLSSCSGGSQQVSSTTPSATTLSVVTGTFVDSAVSGLGYRTASRKGLTGRNGEFEYVPGETVTFFLGGIELGSTPAAPELSPLDLVGVSSVDMARQNGEFDHLVNILVFLQSFDADRDPENGISLTGLNETFRDEQLNFEQSTDRFIYGTYRRLVNQQGGFFQSPKAAINHLLLSLDLSTTVELILQDQTHAGSDETVDLLTDFYYDDHGRLTRLVSTSTRSGAVSESTYDYDLNGRIIRRSAGTTEDLFTYDSLHGLISRETRVAGQRRALLTNEYDAVGNLLQQQIVQNDYLDTPLKFTLRLDQPLYPWLEYRIYFPEVGLALGEEAVPALFRPKPLALILNPFMDLPHTVFTRSTQVSNRYDSEGRLSSSTRTRTINVDSESSTEHSMASFSYTGTLLTNIRMETEAAGNYRLRFDHNAEGQITSCHLDDASQLLTFTWFPLVHSEDPFPDITVCPFMLEYAQDRIVRMSIPSTDTELEFTYTGGRLSDIEITTENQAVFIRSLLSSSYTPHGNVVDQYLLSQTVEVFRATKTYTELTLSQIP